MTHDNRPIRLISIDLETTGLELAAGHVPIEVGATFRGDDENLQWFETRILHEPGTFTWQPKAFEVNGFTLDEISDPETANPPEVVDADLANWLNNQAGDYRLVPLGWNVGSFDWPFIVKWLPETASMFKDPYGNLAHQFADLNSMIFLLKQFGTPPTKKGLHDIAEARAEADHMEVNWHGAGWDSYAALVAFEYLGKWVKQ